MSVETEPGRDAGDLELQRRWRLQFDELPSDGIDERVRAAARAAAESVPQPDGSHVARRWLRIAPLAAAASVALLAVGLVRLMPREEYAAIPASPPLATPRQESPSAPSNAADAAAQAPSPAAAELERAPEFVPDAPPLATPLPDRRAAPPADVAARERAASQPAAKAAAADVPPPTAAVLADAARRTGKDVAALRIVEVTPVDWRDASLGCSQTDSAADDLASVSGFLITVDADGELLRYHTDAGTQVRTCE